MSQLDLLMVHADDRQPVLPSGLSANTVTAGEKPAPRGEPLDLHDEGGDPNDLALQRWGVIVPDSAEGERLLALIAPLVQARCAEQGGKKVQIYKTPNKMTLVEANDWKKQRFDTGKDTSDDVPSYQLILGDLDQVPLAIQQVQSTDNYVGRLVFADDQGYLAYVEKILRWEKQPAAISQARSLIFTVHDQTAATDLGYRSLITPGLEVARRRQQSKQFNASEIVELGDPTLANPDELLREVQKRDPAVLFSLSHGLGTPRGGWRSPSAQRLLQGAMSFGREGVISADSLRGLGEQPFLPGGVWFMLACYGAGTPDTSAYQKWLTELARLGQFGGQPQSVLAGLPKAGDLPFIAALPQAVLRNEQGPLAFIGHVDLAWSYSFAELDSGQPDAKPGRFMDILRYLLKNNRVGVAYQSLMGQFAKVNTELTTYYSRDEAGLPKDPAVAAKRGHLWMLRQDLAGYILLGDPAARLPLQPPPPAVPPATLLKPKPAQLFTQIFDFPVREPMPAPAPAVATATTVSSATESLVPSHLSIEKLEEAIGWLLTGERTPKQIAAGLNLDHTDLQRLLEVYRQGGRRALVVKS